MQIKIEGFICNKTSDNDDNCFQFVMDRIQENLANGILKGQLESFPFYNITYSITLEAN